MKSSRIQLVLIVAAFLLPAVAALLMQTRWFHWDPQTTRNRGELIKPVVPLTTDPAASALFANGHRWSVLVRLPAVCAAECARRIGLLERMREAQGKEMDRVQMVGWSDGSVDATHWLAWQAPSGWPLDLPEGAVALVDPLGNAMMRYRPDADPTDVRKDLAHLLRWSKAGE
jgi:hypothetical protein